MRDDTLVADALKPRGERSRYLRPVIGLIIYGASAGISWWAITATLDTISAVVMP